MTHDDKLEADIQNAAFRRDPHRMLRFPLDAADYSLETMERELWTRAQQADMAALRERYERRIMRLVRCYGQCRHHMTRALADNARMYGTTAERLERGKAVSFWFDRAFDYQVRIMTAIRTILGEAFQ